MLSRRRPSRTLPGQRIADYVGGAARWAVRGICVGRLVAVVTLEEDERRDSPRPCRCHRMGKSRGILRRHYCNRPPSSSVAGAASLRRSWTARGSHGGPLMRSLYLGDTSAFTNEGHSDGRGIAGDLHRQNTRAPRMNATCEFAQSQQRHGDPWRDSFRRRALVRPRRVGVIAMPRGCCTKARKDPCASDGGTTDRDLRSIARSRPNPGPGGRVDLMCYPVAQLMHQKVEWFVRQPPTRAIVPGAADRAIGMRGTQSCRSSEPGVLSLSNRPTRRFCFHVSIAGGHPSGGIAPRRARWSA